MSNETSKLQDKRATLVEQRTELEKSFQQLEAQRTQMIANHNAITGAIQVIDDLLKDSDASNSS
jgi:uncharacterized coiled-coil DUF342 family protein